GGSPNGAFSLTAPHLEKRLEQAVKRFDAARKLSMAMMVILGCMANPAQALTTEEAHAVSAGDNDARIQALHELIPRNDARLPVTVQALLNDSVKVSGEKAYIVEEDKVLDAATGRPSTLPEDAEGGTNTGRMSGELEAVLAVDKLLSPDVAVRAEAIRTIA